MKKYREIREHIKDVELDLIDTTLDDAIVYLTNLRNEIGEQDYWDITIESTGQYDEYDAWELVLYGTRWETDAERDKRLSKAKLSRTKDLEGKRKRLDRLRKEIAKLEKERNVQG